MGIWRFHDIGNSGRCHGHRHDDDDIAATTTTITPNIIHCIIGCNGFNIGSSDPEGILNEKRKRKRRKKKKKEKRRRKRERMGVDGLDEMGIGIMAMIPTP